MKDDKPPEDDDAKPDGPKPDDAPARMTPRLVTNSRFSARDEDFDGANDEALAIRLSMLEEEHRDLDAAITALEQNAPYERLSIARLKKKKLVLKDKIQELKDAMLPDIIA